MPLFLLKIKTSGRIGINILRIIQAALQDLEKGHVVEGGSTITQQLIKNSGPAQSGTGHYSQAPRGCADTANQ